MHQKANALSRFVVVPLKYPHIALRTEFQYCVGYRVVEATVQ